MPSTYLNIYINEMAKKGLTPNKVSFLEHFYLSNYYTFVLQTHLIKMTLDSLNEANNFDDALNTNSDFRFLNLSIPYSTFLEKGINSIRKPQRDLISKTIIAEIPKISEIDATDRVKFHIIYFLLCFTDQYLLTGKSIETIVSQNVLRFVAERKILEALQLARRKKQLLFDAAAPQRKKEKQRLKQERHKARMEESRKRKKLYVVRDQQSQ